MLRSRLAAVALTIVAASATCTTMAAGSRAGAAEPGAAAATVAPAVDPVPAVVPAPGPAGTCVDRLLVALTDPRLLAAQVLVVAAPLTGFRADAVPLLADGAGGVMLTGRTEAGVAATRTRSDALLEVARRTSAISPFVAVDQEGGQVQTLRGPGFETIPSATDQGRLPAGELRSRASAWAQSLHRAGVTLDFAPVADVLDPALGTQNLSVGSYHRTYGTTPASVTDGVLAFAGALRDSRVAATVKHFPGLGAVAPNTDDTRDVHDTATSGTSAALKPFAKAVSAGVPVVMVSTAVYTRIDPQHPAAFSAEIITDLLRKQLGFSGVVVSDDLGAAQAVADVDPGQRAVSFVAAGGDLVLSVEPATAKPMLAALVGRMTDDPGFAAKVRASVRRILTLKQRLGLLACG